MSFFPGQDPAAGNKYQCDALKAVIVPRTADLGDGFTVRRALPSAQSRMVGPFVFFDHFGPTVFSPATASTCGRIRTSGSPPSPTCSTARSCTATASAPPCRSGPARSTG